MCRTVLCICQNVFLNEKLLFKGLTSVIEKGILSTNNVYSIDWDFTQNIKQI